MSRSPSENGSALFIVLGCVALMTLLIVAFLSASMTERATSNSFAKEVNSKLLSENAVNLVISQLKAGTKSTSAQTANSVAWASQPGMIRAYDATGKADSYYKLYSWDNMVGKGAYANTDVPDTAWAAETDLFTDLNETVNGRNPIISALDNKGHALASLNVAGHSGVLSYDSSGTGTPDVEGFYIDPATAAGGAANAAAMPVKWLYVLGDGSLVIPVLNGANGVTVAGASKANPIVGRIAFWTDDETSKVNINTASEGSFWDVPLAYNVQEIGGIANNANTAPWAYANAVPSGTEYQRVPGHPATTSLSTVFGSAQLPMIFAKFPSGNTSSTTDYDSYLAPYLTLTPRYAPGGTKGGSRADPIGIGTAGALALNPPAYRLYDSFDELTFDPQRQALSVANSTLYSSANGASPSGRTALSALSPAVIEQDKFFLTTHSRGPEETLFGTPRINLWPLQAAVPSIASASLPNGLLRNAHDQLLAFCSTINNFPYYFQRATVWGYGTSAGTFNQSSIPGVGSNFSALSSTQDFPAAPTGGTTLTGVARNENLFAYLQKLTSQSIPGFGGDFLSKYPAGAGGVSDRDHILAEMFELIRSGINTVSTSIVPYYTYTGYEAGSTTNATAKYMAPGSTIPVRIPVTGGNVKGLGRTLTVGGITIVFYATNWLDKTTLNTAAGSHVPTAGSDGLPDDVANIAGTYDGYGDPQTTTFRAIVLLQPCGTLVGSPFYNPYLRYQISGLDGWTVSFSDGTTSNLNFPGASQTALISTQHYSDARISGFLGTLYSTVLGSTSLGANYAKRVLGTSDGDVSVASNLAAYPFASMSDVAIPNSINGGAAAPSPFGGPAPSPRGQLRTYAPTKITFSGGAIQIKIFSGVDASGSPGMANAELIQTINMSVPQMNLQVPTIEPAYPLFPSPERDVALGRTGPPAVARQSDQKQADFYYQASFDSRNYNNRFPTGPAGAAGSTVNGLIMRGDVVRAMALNPASKIAGDLRLLAAMDTVPVTLPGDTQNVFAPLGSGVTISPNNTAATNLPDWNNPDIRMVHALLQDPGNLRIPLLRVDSNPAVDPLVWYPGTGARFETTSYSPGSHNADANGGIGVSSGNLITGFDYPSLTAPNVTPELKGAYMDPSTQTMAGDWSSGIGPLQDGPFLVKPDEGYQDTSGGNSAYLFFGLNSQTGKSAGSINSLSPNRQVPSPLIFGSLPSGLENLTPWRTLLFCPNPAAANKHPGFGVGSGTKGQGDYAPYTIPPDHLLLDLFWMPVVEPYAISDALSTAGKVNLNYQIVPFGYIHRSTAVRAAFKSTRLMAVPNTATAYATTSYKSNGIYQQPTWGATAGPSTFRYPINLDATIDASDSPFLSRFSGTQTGTPDVFRSASEVCNLYLVPKLDPSVTNYVGAGAAVPANYTSTPAWWSSFKLTGDNGRESPYNQLYSRLTTKSNSFQVHFRVQTLVRNSANDSAVFDSTKGDSIGGEYRGSSIIERYIDPNDTSLPDFAAGATSFTTTGTTLDSYYRYRVVRSKSFTP